MVARVAVAALVAVRKRRIGLEIGAGQVVQQHVEAGVEQIPPPLDQVIEQRLLVRQQPVVTGIELVDLREGEVRAQQVSQRAALEPRAVQTPLAARRQQAVCRQHEQDGVPARALAARRQPLRPELVELQLPPQRQGEPAGPPLPRPAQPHP